MDRAIESSESRAVEAVAGGSAGFLAKDFVNEWLCLDFAGSDSDSST